jgi:hypothetical protein
MVNHRPLLARRPSPSTRELLGCSTAAAGRTLDPQYAYSAARSAAALDVTETSLA